MAGSLHELTDATFGSEVLEAKGVVLVDLWAPWCGPCLRLTPTLEALAGEVTGKARVVKVNVDNCQSTAGSLGVTSIPTVILFKDGKEVTRMVGCQPKDAYLKAIESA
ncbi:MAG: thioredoxin [Planctomycetaceae bacterium]|jgi:thioredoxin 1